MADAAPAVVPVAADHDAAIAPENAPELPNNEDQDVDTTASAGPAKKSLLKGLTGGVTASLKNVAKQMQTGIEQINHGIKDNISTATASMSHAAAAASGAAAQSMASAFTVSSSWSQPPLDRTASQITEAVYRTRDLRKSTESVSKRFLAREVDYAGIAAGGYNKTMKEIQNSKAVLRPLHDSVGTLAFNIGNARGVAARLVHGAPPIPVEQAQEQAAGVFAAADEEAAVVPVAAYEAVTEDDTATAAPAN